MANQEQELIATMRTKIAKLRVLAGGHKVQGNFNDYNQCYREIRILEEMIEELET